MPQPVFYLEEDVDEELKNSEIRISRTKLEDLLLPLRETTTYSFFKAIAEDNILRLLLFSEYNINFNVAKEFPIELEFPLFLSNQESFIEKKSDRIYSEKLEDISSKEDKVEKEVKELSFGSSQEFLSTIISDTEVMNALRVGRPSGDRLQQALKNSMEKHQSIFEQTFTNMLRMTEKMQYSLELSELRKCIGDAEDAQKNFEKLKFALNLPKEKQYLFDSLNKMGAMDSVNLNLSSMCLECQITHNKYSYYLKEENVEHDVNLKQECPNCRSGTLFHKITIGCSASGLHNLALSDRLNEALIGMSLSEIDDFEKIYVGKKVSYKPDNVQKGVELDVSAITKDKKLVIFEVTTTSRESNALTKLSKKMSRYAERQIPYDLLIFITPSEIFQEYFLFGGGEQVYVLSAKHIPILKKVVKDLLEKID